MGRPWVALAVACLCAIASVTTGARANEPASPIDSAFKAFWDAGDTGAAERAARRVLAAAATFDQIRERLKAGRPYIRARTGRVEMRGHALGIPLDNAVEIPADYDPSRAWPARVSLHGGVARPAPAPDEEPPRPIVNRLPMPGEIVLLPRAWATTEWWTANQVENILRLLDRAKRTYNIDESRVSISGFSDGGTGVLFLAMRAATPWSACVPLHGQPLVLANPRLAVDGQLYAGNLVNCPLRVVNGGRDPLYPAAEVAPFVQMFRRAGASLDFQVYAEAAHDMSWWPEERPRLEAFLASHRRAPHPDRLSWETDRTDRYHRFRWLVIDQLGARESDQMLEDVNTFSPGDGEGRPLFRRSKRSGRVDARWRGNTFELRTRGVQRLTVLLPADEAIDFARPVTVTVNGRTVHHAVVRPDPATMLTWAARDNDRTMLYAAALRIDVP